MSTVYLNGRFLPEDQAYVSALDRGFIFGDGVYEVIPAFGGTLFRLPQHLRRLDDSLAAIRLTNPLNAQAWHDTLTELVTGNGGGDQSVYVQITRGVAPRNHAFPRGVPPTVFAMCSKLAGLPAHIHDQGVAAVALEDIRWKYCHIKAISLLPNTMLRQQAIEAGADEAILIRDGNVTEGAASNVFAVNHGIVLTPPKGALLLPGITRDLVLELAAANGIAAQEQTISEAALRGADEIWLTSSTREILPVTRLDGTPVGDGTPGPLWRRMYRLYQEFKRSPHADP